MIFKLDNKWIKVNPDVSKEWDRRQQAERRSLFDKGIFRVAKQEGGFHLFVGDWSVGCWSNSERARTIISAAVSTYQGLQRRGMLK